MSERASWVPRLALIGGLRRSYGRERGKSGDLRYLVTYGRRERILSSAREHDLRASVVSRGSARGLEDAGAACFVGSRRTAASKASIVAPFNPVSAGETRRHLDRARGMLLNLSHVSVLLNTQVQSRSNIHLALTNLPCASCCLTALAVCIREHINNGCDQHLAEA